MAAINDLISQIQDETLRNRIQEEVSKMAKQKKFGLVFEEHMPESTPLYDMPIKRGCNVMRRDSKDDKSIYVVLRVEGDTAVCVKPEQKDEAVTFDLKDIVRVAEFGESIYPYLKPLDSVCNAPDSDLWHTLIEADNYHALQLLEYLYAGKVDCIYIDPPYNTGAKDWKYNNDYVDGSDAYRHSKWLSFMQRRLKLAKKLLNPKDYLAHKVDFIAEIFLCTMILFGNVGAQPAASFLLKFASFAKFLKQPESLCCFCTNQIFNFFSCNTAVFQCILKNE